MRKLASSRVARVAWASEEQTMAETQSFDLTTLESALSELGRRSYEAGITNSKDALTLVEKFYPHNMIEPKTRFGLEEIFSSLEVQPLSRSTPPRKP